jgi:hypothetical protein
MLIFTRVCGLRALARRYDERKKGCASSNFSGMNAQQVISGRSAVSIAKRCGRG